MNPQTKFFNAPFQQLILTLVFIVGISLLSQAQISHAAIDTTIVAEGKYKGENFMILQMGKLIKAISVNGNKVNDSVFSKSSICEVNLADYHLNIGDPVAITIVYDHSKSDIQLMNPYSLTNHPLLNAQLPQLAANDLTGKKINTGTMKNQVILINTWFVGCKPCANEMPELNTVVKKYAKKNVVFIAPCLSDEKKINEFLTDHQFDYAIVPNSEDYCKKDLKCASYPVNIVVNKKGEVIYLEHGYHKDIAAQLSSEIEKALTE